MFQFHRPSCQVSVPPSELPSFSSTVRVAAFQFHRPSCCVSVPPSELLRFSSTVRVAAFQFHRPSCCVSVPPSELLRFSSTVRVAAFQFHRPSCCVSVSRCDKRAVAHCCVYVRCYFVRVYVFYLGHHGRVVAVKYGSNFQSRR